MAAILNSIVLSKILWGAHGNKCTQVVGENLFLFKLFKPDSFFISFSNLKSETKDTSNQFEDQNQIYTHNMHAFVPWASHNTFSRTLEFDMAAVSVKRPIIDLNETLLVDLKDFSRRQMMKVIVFVAGVRV